jgi:signal transduction histidine kinase
MSTVPVDELRTLFLFEALNDEQLTFLSERSERRTYDADAWVVREGEPADFLIVLLEGSIQLMRRSGTEEVVFVETDHRGAYAGAIRAYITEEDQSYNATLKTVEASSFLCLRAEDFAYFMSRYFPMAVHLLDGLYLGIRNSEGAVREREHLARLGALSANLGHELNNPAAAAARATSQLRRRVSDMRGKLAMIAEGRIAPDNLQMLVKLQQEVVDRAGDERPRLTSLQEADLEDELADRLDSYGVAGSGDLAPIYASAGLDVDWLEGVHDALGEGEREGALRWLAYTLEAEQLMDEIQDATGRISTLVAAVKQYSYMDTASVQDIDLHVGLDATVAMLGHKLAGVTVQRDYATDLPRVPAYPGELNQVWTNLIDNAVGAMGGTGTLLLRICRDADDVLVEVGDTGRGIPADVQPHVFEAFYTTKAPGEGTGLGLETVLRIVERRHHGTVGFTTGPEGTTFSVRLPLEQRLS